MTRRAHYVSVGTRVRWWLLAASLKLAGWLAVAAVAAAVWPLTVTAAAGYGAAWLRGWPPARLWRAAVWSLAMIAVYLFAAAVAHGTWQSVALAPIQDWRQSWHQAAGGNLAAAFLVTTPSLCRPGLRWPACCGDGGSMRSAPAWPASRRARL